LERTAFVGASGPIIYDYKNALDSKYPNPILESPLGLMTLYDKIVFLHPAVCPKTMQKGLDFVEFLSDKTDIKDYHERLTQEIIETQKERNLKEEFETMIKKNDQVFANIATVRKRIGPFAEHGDNHSRAVEEVIVPNSANSENVWLDNLISFEKRYSLVTNSAIADIMNNEIMSVLPKIDLTGKILSKHIESKSIPNYVNADGPYVDTIYDIRNRAYIKQFRDKIDEIILSNDNKSLDELVLKVEKDYDRAERELARKQVKNWRMYETIYDFSALVASEFLKQVPFLGTAMSIFGITNKALETYEDRNSFAWTGFLIDVEDIPPSVDRSTAIKQKGRASWPKRLFARRR
jgi:hypothetical protein